jgi:desulfoferrodoxin-like iron-binding protein
MVSDQEEVRRMVKGKMGKTYHCDICGQECKVTKEGVGILVCCNKPMREL